MNKGWLKYFWRILILTIILFFIFFLINQFSLFPSSKKVRVIISPGQSIDEIGKLLVEKKVIRNAIIFKLLVWYWGVDRKIDAGEYLFKEDMGYRRVTEILTKDPLKKVFKVTIPEGFTIEQIGNRLSSQTNIDGNEFKTIASTGNKKIFNYSFLSSNPLGTLEGYLFPATYYLVEGSSPREAVDLMLRQFGKEISSQDLEKIKAKGLNLHQLITIASMIEKEAKLPHERPIIAAVIYNRLQRKMRLEIDATVQYALGEWKSRLYERDTQVNSPYNTYIHFGLPPGPICSPGLASIKAALNPSKVNYLYYVLTDPKGSHTFTQTHKEFLKAKEKAKKIFKN